jgi:AMMECR1 domain-containing protein
VLSDLAQRGRVHAATLALVERTPEWRNYESEVNFELNVLRMRYASTPGSPMTPMRRAQMQAHLRAAQRKVMEEHADRAAKAFVGALAPGDAAALRGVVGRLDTPGLGRRALEGAAGAAGEDAESLRVAAEELRDSLWELSALVGEKGGAGERKK